MNHVNMIVTDRILNESCILVKLPVHVHEALECEMQQVIVGIDTLSMERTPH